MIDRGRHNVLGIGIHAVDYDAAVGRIIAAAQARQPLAVSALAVHGVMTGVLDRQHRYRLNGLDLVVPDGQPVRWALNWLHRTGLGERVYGPHLMLKTCAQAAADGVPIYLYGSTHEILEQLAHKLREQFPALVIAGQQPSQFRRLTPAERDDAVAAIRASGAQITFVGLGCPRQEVFAFELREALSMPIMAVGAAFAFHAGLLSQAPAWYQDRGLEWFYRLVQEPRRLWKRYVLLNPLYLTLLGLQRSGLYRIDPASASPPQEELLYG